MSQLAQDCEHQELSLTANITYMTDGLTDRHTDIIGQKHADKRTTRREKEYKFQGCVYKFSNQVVIIAQKWTIFMSFTF